MNKHAPYFQLWYLFFFPILYLKLYGSFHLCHIECRFCIDPFIAVTDLRRQNLTSTDVRFRRLKSVPALKEYTIYNGRRPIT